MSHHFVSANLWFAVGLILLLGNGPSHPTARYEAFYGYGKFDTFPAGVGIAAPFAVAFWNLRRWREAERRKIHPAVLYAGANAWFILGLTLLLGLGQHPSSSQYLAVFGYGRLFYGTPYVGVGLIFAAAVWNFRQWRRANQPSEPKPEPVAPPPAPIVAQKLEAWPAVVILAIAAGSLLLMFFAVVRPNGQPVMVRTAPKTVVRQQTEVDQPPFLQPEIVQPEIVHPQAVTPAQFQQAESVPSRMMIVVPVVTFMVLFAAALFAMGRTRHLNADRARSRPVAVHGPGYWMVVGAWVLAGLIVFYGLLLKASKPEPYALMLFIAAALVVGGVPTIIRYFSRSQPQPRAYEAVASEPPPLPPPVVHPRTCPQCHAALAADAPQGLCPRCLMAGAFQSILNPSRTGPFAGTFEPPPAEEVQEHFPHLEVVGLIGQGGMGAVYQARQPNLDRTVALKLIRPREDNPMFAERFVREAKAMAKLSHPNIVHVHESGESGGSLYLVMEFVDGVTLREAIKAKAIPPAEALKIVGQLCDALEYAHAQGVVHRDIKPENILLDRTGRVKVVDFGLAKLASDNAVSLTHTRQAMGTPHYMAPEQWEKPTEVDHRADIYALGVVIYELLTGELPLGRFDPPSVKAHLDARIDEVVLRLLAKEPDRRYQRASDVRTALFNIGAAAFPAPRVRRRDFFEYRSDAELWGWPLVHVVSGIDPRTGTKRVAKGWLAIGDVMAVGGVAMSGVCAVGVVSVAGVVGLGGLALAGAIAVAGVSIGGTAVGFFSLGGVALGWLAVGGVAVGKFAIGGAAVGEHVLKKGGDSGFWKELREDFFDLFDG